MDGDEISLVDSHNGKRYVMNTENFDMYTEILANYKHRASQMDLMPIWTPNAQKYVTFQVMSRQRPLRDDVDDIFISSLENSDRIKCHLCDVDIPSCYMESHESSANHALYKDIADIALERVRRQMSVARPCPRTSSDNTYFCEYCCASVAKSNSTVHDSTKEHRECVDRDKAVEKFLMKYKGIDFNNRNGKDKLPFNKVPAKNCQSNRIEGIKTVYFYESDNQSIIEDSIKSTREIETVDSNATMNRSKLESKGVTLENTEENMKECVIKETFNDKTELTEPKKQVGDVKIKDKNQKLCNEAIHNLDGKSSKMNSEYVGLEETSATDGDLKTYISVLNEISVNKLKYISEKTIEIHPFDGSKVKVKLNHFHGYVDREGYVYCTLCDKQVTDVKEHRYGKKHMAKITALVDDENCIRQVESTKYHCVLCNQLFADKHEHLSMINHSKALLFQEISDIVNNNESGMLYQTDNGKFICIKCTEYVDRDYIQKHINTDTHKYNVNKMPIDLKKIVVDDYCNVCKREAYDKKHLRSFEHRVGVIRSRLSSGDILHYHLKDSKVPYKTCCTICNIEIDKTKTSVDSHFSSESHISAYDRLLLENEIQKIDAFSFYYECKVCKKRFPMIDVKHHTRSRAHKRFFKDVQKTHSVPYFYELTDCPTKVRCKLCNIQVNYDFNDLRTHRKNTLHKSNFASTVVQKNRIEEIGRSYYCQCCDDIINYHKTLLMEHCFSHAHITKFLAMGPPLDRHSLLIKARNKLAQHPKMNLKLRNKIEVMISESLKSIDTKEKDAENSLSDDKLDSLSFYTAIEESKIDEADSYIEIFCNEENNPVVNELEIVSSNKSVAQSSDSAKFDTNSTPKDEDTIIHDRSVLSINEHLVAPDDVRILSDKIVRRCDQFQDQDQCDTTEIVTYCFLVNERISIINDESFEGLLHKAVNYENAEIYICKICDTEIDNNRSKIIQHMEGVKHDQNYRSLLLLNKMREYNENIFCDVCKELCNKIDLLNHLVKAEHTFNLEEYVENSKNVKNVFQTFLALSHKNFLMQQHGDKLYCKLCNVDVKDEFGDVKKHILTEYHFKAYEKLLSENEVTRNKHKSFCEICKADLFDLWELQHIYSKHHVDSRTLNTKCYSAERNVQAVTRRVRQRNKKKVIENNLAVSREVSDNCNPGLEAKINKDHFINDLRKVEYYYYNDHDSISKITSKQPLLNDQSEKKKSNDSNDQSEKKKSNNQLDDGKSKVVSMVVKKADKVKMFTCVVCNKPIPNDPMTILNHNNSKIHSENVREYLENLSQNRKPLLDTSEKNKSVNVDVDTNNIDVVVNGFCSVCKKNVPDNPKNVIVHINGKPHKDNIKLNLETQKNVVFAPVVHEKSPVIVGVSNTITTDKNLKISECGQIKSDKVANYVPTTEAKVEQIKINVSTVTNTKTNTNTTETITQNGFCTICKKDVPNTPQNIKQHVKGLSHQTKLKSIVQNKVPEKTFTSKQPNDYESVVKRGMCNVCHKQVGNSPQNIKEHIQGRQHRSKLLSFASHSKTMVASEMSVVASNKLNLDLESKASESAFKLDSIVSTCKISTSNKMIPVVLPNKSCIDTNLDVTLKSSELVVKLDPTINYNDIQGGFCKLCVREVPNNLSNLEEHIKGTLHQNNLKKILKKEKDNESADSKTVESKLSAMNKVATITESVNNINQLEVNIQQIDDVCYDPQRNMQNESNNTNTKSGSPSVNSSVMTACDIKETKANAEISTVVVPEHNLNNTINFTVRVPGPKTPRDTSCENPSLNICQQTETSENTQDIIKSDVKTYNVFEPKIEDDKDSSGNSCKRRTVKICEQTDDTLDNTEDITNTDFRANNVFEHEMEGDKDAFNNSGESTPLKVTAQTDETFKNTYNAKDNDVKINNAFETPDNGFFLCRICDLTIDNNPVEIREHLNGFRHKNKIQKMREENIEMETCYEKYYCDICDIKMDRISLTVSQHNESLAHLKMFDLMLQSNQIQTKKDVCYCELCDLYFTKYSVPTHVKRQSHKQRFLDVEIES